MIAVYTHTYSVLSTRALVGSLNWTCHRERKRNFVQAEIGLIRSHFSNLCETESPDF